MISKRSRPSLPMNPSIFGDAARGGHKASPEPRLPVKHALNPPIVTIFGAGVAGLSAAHELVERGFLVQVVEKAEDPYSPGRPLVGGMAANQYGRVRANLEDLHQPLFNILTKAHAPKAEKEAAAALLKLFAFNRVRWIHTEKPAEVTPSLYCDPEPADASPGAFAALQAQLLTARETYRKRWLWDITVAGALTQPPTPNSGNGNWPPASGALANALSVFNDLLGVTDAALLAKELVGHQGATGDVTAAIVAYHELVKEALDREFLAFRLIPCIREGVSGADAAARALLKKWSERIVASTELRDHYLAGPAMEPVLPARGQLSDAVPAAWLRVEVIEEKIPGEHGYRFFPSSYRHLDDTMKRIPILGDCCQNVRTVIDNMRSTTTQGLGMTYDERDQSKEGPGPECVPSWKKVPPSPARQKGAPDSLVVKIERDRAKSVKGLRERTDRFVQSLGGTRRDGVLFFSKLLRFMLASTERRQALYEKKNWGEFIEIDQYSPAMRAQLGAASQVLLAFSLAEADTRTYGDTVTQLMLDMFSDGERVDRTLNGPTSEAWLEPWRLYLENKGVRFFLGQLEHLTIDAASGELMPKVKLEGDGRSQDGYALLEHDNDLAGHRPDFYILALELGGVLKAIKPIRAAPPSGDNDDRDLESLAHYGHDLTTELKDMTGAQFFFDAKTSIGQGHMYYPLAPWGLSAISQSEFWAHRGGFSDGYIGVLSVDIAKTKKDHKDPRDKADETASFWETFKKAWNDLPTQDAELKDLYARLVVSRRVRDEIARRTGYSDHLGIPRCFHVDQNILTVDGTDETNHTKYLAATPKTWENRAGRYQDEKDKYKEIVGYSLNRKRWVFAGTYMATYTRMTTMEAANESGRHAAITILRRLTDTSLPEKDDRLPPCRVTVNGHSYDVYTGENKEYNGYSIDRVFDEPDIWNPERNELDDLESLRRIDADLFRRDKDWPHIFDLLDVDKKLKLALDAAEIYGDDSHLHQLMPLTLASLDRAATQLGPGDDKSVLTDSLAKIFDALTSPAAAPTVNAVKDFIGNLKKAP